jgi:hypothetical protein
MRKRQVITQHEADDYKACLAGMPAEMANRKVGDGDTAVSN